MMQHSRHYHVAVVGKGPQYLMYTRGYTLCNFLSALRHATFTLVSLRVFHARSVPCELILRISSIKETVYCSEVQVFIHLSHLHRKTILVEHEQPAQYIRDTIYAMKSAVLPLRISPLLSPSWALESGRLLHLSPSTGLSTYVGQQIHLCRPWMMGHLT